MVKFDYQSDRHCAKTRLRRRMPCNPFDYQSDRHCAKTEIDDSVMSLVFDYQSDRHCAKTLSVKSRFIESFDYQSDRHCAKTIGANSPLQRTFGTDWYVSSALNKVQVNHFFSLMLMIVLIAPVLQEQNTRFLEKHLVKEEYKVIF